MPQGAGTVPSVLPLSYASAQSPLAEVFSTARRMAAAPEAATLHCAPPIPFLLSTFILLQYEQCQSLHRVLSMPGWTDFWTDTPSTCILSTCVLRPAVPYV